MGPVRAGAIALTLTCAVAMLGGAAGLGVTTGCKSQKSDPGGATPGAGEPGDRTAGGAAGKAGGGASASAGHGKKKTSLLRRADVKAVIDRWLAAQNQGDFATYSSLYGAEFHGVRRSGKTIVRLDRAGWLADRQRMFKRPMTVAISSLEIAVSTRHAEVRFVQDWGSGKYHDVGPKVMVVASTPAGLRIVSEEMLSSVLLAASDDLPLASPELALLYQGMLLVSEDVEVDWRRGKPVLQAGAIPEQDPECITDPPDYETDNDRYFTCSAAEPENAYDLFVATQAVAARTVPRELTAWTGRQLALYGSAGKLCEASAGNLLAFGQWKSTVAGLAARSNVGADVAEAVLDNRAVLMAELSQACPGAVFARAASLPAPAQWAIREASGPLRALLDRAVKELPSYEIIMEAEYERNRVITLLDLVPPGKGRRFAVASIKGPASCHEDAFGLAIWEVEGADSALALGSKPVFETSDRPITIQAAPDITADGIPELVVDDGVLIWWTDAFMHFQPLEFPVEVLDTCHCECE